MSPTLGCFSGHFTSICLLSSPAGRLFDLESAILIAITPKHMKILMSDIIKKAFKTAMWFVPASGRYWQHFKKTLRYQISIID